MVGTLDREKRGECPIPNTHSRLEQAHLLWHQTLERYDDPDSFCANLNSTIEALRNVTFMLQSEKSAIPNFDAWYPECQAGMKADVIMKWLQNARTTIVHKSNLKTQSTAHASVHNNLTLAHFDIEIPPLVSTSITAMYIAANLPDSFMPDRRDLMLSVERRWGVEELPDQELLDALAHAYGVLYKIVTVAHERAGIPRDQRSPHEELVKATDGRLPCMITTAEVRTVRMTLSDYQPLVPSIDEVQHDPSIDEKVAKRYGSADSNGLYDFPDNPLAFAETLIPVAKRVLAKDKYHGRFVFLHTPSGWQIVELNARDRPEKYVLAQILAQMVQRYQADAIVQVGEVWMSLLEKMEGRQNPEYAPDKQEALMINVADSQGFCRIITVPFRRALFGKIKFSETEVTDSTVPYWLANVFKVWNLPLPTLSGNEDPSL